MYEYKKIVSLMIFTSLSTENVSSAPLFHVISCTPTKSNLYFASSLAIVLSDPDLHRILVFHVPHLVPIFRCFRRRSSLSLPFCNIYVFTVRSC